MATVLKAYYNGAVFVPTMPVDLQKWRLLLITCIQATTHRFSF
jgi:hypothetical protein